MNVQKESVDFVTLPAQDYGDRFVGISVSETTSLQRYAVDVNGWVDWTVGEEIIVDRHLLLALRAGGVETCTMWDDLVYDIEVECRF